MPQVEHYKVTATVEFVVDGPFSYAEAVKFADDRLARLDTMGDKTPLNGVKQVNVTSLEAERRWS